MANMDSNRENINENNPNPLEAAAEQWVNLVLAHITYKQTNKNNYLDKNKKENKNDNHINF
jgi:hypothetical protein